MLLFSGVVLHFISSYLVGMASFMPVDMYSLALLSCNVEQQVNYNHFPAHLFCFCHLSSTALHQLCRLSQLNQHPDVLYFPLPYFGPFIFRVQGYPYHFAEPGQYLHTLHIIIKELQAVVLLLHRMAFHLVGECCCVVIQSYWHPLQSHFGHFLRWTCPNQ